MSNYNELIEKKKKELQRQLDQLNHLDVAALEAEKQKHLDAIARIDAQIAETLKSLGIVNGANGNGSKLKYEGKQVSANRLKELINESEEGELNLRKGGYDTAQIKKLIAQNSELFVLGGKGAWPTVTLKK